MGRLAEFRVACPASYRSPSPEGWAVNRTVARDG